jgi:hypothetical protein
MSNTEIHDFDCQCDKCRNKSKTVSVSKPEPETYSDLVIKPVKDYHKSRVTKREFYPYTEEDIKKAVEKARRDFAKNVRKAVADYMSSEGCSCCQDEDGHKKHKKVLAKLLDVPMYDDKSGYDFYQFKTKKKALSEK